MGLLPILPLYATQFGATPTIVGIYLAVTYLSITVGTMLTGWLAAQLGHKRLFIGAGVLGIPTLVLLGQATALWQVMILTATVWFCGGIGLTLVSVFTGLFTDDNSRGKSFGLTWLAFPLAALIGGITVGQLVKWQGYPMMFAVLGVVLAGWPVVGLLLLEYKSVPVSATSTEVTDKDPLRLGRTFHLVLLVALLSATTVYTSRLGMSLSMQALNFSPRAVASTSSVGGLVTIPVTLLIGVLSDRLGRNRFLILGYLLAAGGALMLSTSTQLWHFWLASGLLFVAMCVNGSVAPAFIADLLAPKALSRGLPWLNAVTRIGDIVGFASAGYLMDTLGATGFFVIAAAVSVVAATLLALPHHERRTVPQVQPSRAGI
jgi:MFS family permease